HCCVRVPWPVVPTGNSRHAAWTRRESAAVFALTTPRRDGGTVHLGPGRRPSGVTVRGRPERRLSLRGAASPAGPSMCGLPHLEASQRRARMSYSTSHHPPERLSVNPDAKRTLWYYLRAERRVNVVL